MRKRFTWCAVMLALTLSFFSVHAEPREELVLIDSPYFFYTDSDTMQRAISVFKERNPGINIVVREYDGDHWKEQLLTSIMSETDQVDILPTYDDMYFAYLNHGLLKDLFAYPGFREITDSWIDISPLFVEDQHLYSVPMRFLDISFCWNEALAKELGVDTPSMDWTWSDFSRLADAVRQSWESSSAGHAYLFAESREVIPLFVWHYTCAYRDALIKGAKRYDDEEFRNLMTFWKQAMEEDLFFPYAGLTQVDYSRVLIQDEAFIDGGTESAYLLFPQLGGRSTPVTVTGLGVYEKSKFPEKAAELLQIYASRDNITASYPEEGVFLEDLSYWQGAEDPISWSGQRVDYFRYMLNHSVRNDMVGDFESAVGQAWSCFLEGSLTDDEFIASLEEALRRTVEG